MKNSHLAIIFGLVATSLWMLVIAGQSGVPWRPLVYGVLFVVSASVSLTTFKPLTPKGAILVALGYTAFFVSLSKGAWPDLFHLGLALLFGAIAVGYANRPGRIAIGFTILIASGVAWFSDGTGGPDPFRNWVMQTLAVNADQAQSIVVAVRKTVHFTAYGVYGLTWRRFGWKCALWQTAMLATFDEARQTTSSVRTGSPLDVLLDLSGAIVLLAVADWWSKRAKRA